jgi:hypothetical protein
MPHSAEKSSQNHLPISRWFAHLLILMKIEYCRPSAK